jgi:hypothetical protein
MIYMGQPMSSPDLVQTFDIYRTTGGFGEGGWVPIIGGKVVTAEIDDDNAGEGYDIDDILTVIQTGASGATLKVTDIDIDGAIRTLEIVTPGASYITNVSQSVSVVPAGGTGAKVNITASVLNPQVIPCYGVVSVISQKELDMLPEGDRIKGAMVFHCTTEMKITREGANSDQIKWQGEFYRLFNIWPYGSYGFYKAAGARIEGM